MSLPTPERVRELADVYRERARQIHRTPDRRAECADTAAILADWLQMHEKEDEPDLPTPSAQAKCERCNGSGSSPTKRDMYNIPAKCGACNGTGNAPPSAQAREPQTDAKGNVWPASLMIRDTQIIPDDGAGRIYTTTGFGYEKRKYVREDAATAPVSAQAREALEAGARLCDNVPSTRHGEYARVLRSLSVGGVNRTTIRIEVLRALFEYATADKQFPIDEPFNTYLRETMAALAAPVSA